jgi:hypothetical protein
MFAKRSPFSQLSLAVVLVMSVVCACGSHAGAEGSGPTVGDSTLRDPDNPYWQGRPLNFDWVDPAQGPGMR